MDLIDRIRSVLHLLADLLVWPVFAGLIASAAIVLIAAGSAAREFHERRQGTLSRREQTTLSGLRLATTAEDPPVEVMAELQRAERMAWTAVARIRLLVRLGPALGLMGTLIPMAYALQGLSEGNLPSLAGNLVTAFAATVIGLAISVVAYLIAAAREEWARQDVERWSVAAERMLREGMETGDA